MVPCDDLDTQPIGVAPASALETLQKAIDWTPPKDLAEDGNDIPRRNFETLRLVQSSAAKVLNRTSQLGLRNQKKEEN